MSTHTDYMKMRRESQESTVSKMSKDKTPNRTLALAVDLKCDRKDCDQHGTISRMKSNGTVERRCIEHLHNKVDENAYLLKFLNLA